MPDSGGEQAEEIPKKQRDLTSARAILISFAFCLVGMFVVLFVVLVGLTLANKEKEQANAEQQDSTVVAEIIPVDYEYKIYGYNLKPEILRGDDSFILSKIGQSTGKAVTIRSQEKLDDLMFYLSQYDDEDGEPDKFELDYNFFKSSSIIAVSLENNIYSIAEDKPVKDLHRDQYYDLRLKVNSAACGVQGYNSCLLLLKVENIQPQTIYLDYAE